MYICIDIDIDIYRYRYILHYTDKRETTKNYRL